MEFFQWTLDLEIADTLCVSVSCEFVVKPSVDAQYWFDSGREQTTDSSTPSATASAIDQLKLLCLKYQDTPETPSQYI